MLDPHAKGALCRLALTAGAVVRFDVGHLSSCGESKKSIPLLPRQCRDRERLFLGSLGRT
jgi:hypothetical protein